MFQKTNQFSLRDGMMNTQQIATVKMIADLYEMIRFYQ